MYVITVHVCFVCCLLYRWFVNTNMFASLQKNQVTVISVPVTPFYSSPPAMKCPMLWCPRTCLSLPCVLKSPPASCHFPSVVGLATQPKWLETCSSSEWVLLRSLSAWMLILTPCFLSQEEFVLSKLTGLVRQCWHQWHHRPQIMKTRLCFPLSGINIIRKKIGEYEFQLTYPSYDMII